MFAYQYLFILGTLTNTVHTQSLVLGSSGMTCSRTRGNHKCTPNPVDFHREKLLNMMESFHFGEFSNFGVSPPIWEAH